MVEVRLRCAQRGGFLGGASGTANSAQDIEEGADNSEGSDGSYRHGGGVKLQIGAWPCTIQVWVGAGSERM